MATIGIDFGSSYTTVAWINPQTNKAEAVLFEGDGSVKMPSGILAVDNDFVFGSIAKSYFDEANSLQANSDIINNYILNLKRNLSPDTLEYFFEKEYNHVKILSCFFKYIKEETSKHCGNSYDIDMAVITHPVDFSETRIKVIIDAAKRAGFNNVKTLYEPDAAAIGYSKNHKIDDGLGILVFDYGGGTVDVSYLTKEGNSFIHFVQPRGNSNCGGQDIDMLLYEHFRHAIIDDINFGFDISSSGKIDYSCLMCCRILKERFSSNGDYHFTEGLLFKNGKPVKYKFSLSRNDFNEIIYNKVSEAIDVAKTVIEEVKSKNLLIDKVLLIGGSSKLSLINERLLELTGVTPETCGERDIAVALGAVSSSIINCEETNEEKDIEEKKEGKKESEIKIKKPKVIRH